MQAHQVKHRLLQQSAQIIVVVDSRRRDHVRLQAYCAQVGLCENLRTTDIDVRQQRTAGYQSLSFCLLHGCILRDLTEVVTQRHFQRGIQRKRNDFRRGLPFRFTACVRALDRHSGIENIHA